MRHFFATVCLAAVTSAAATSAWAADAGKLIFVAGSAQVAGKPAVQGTLVSEGETLVTGADGYIYIKTADNGLFILRPNTEARIASYHIDTVNPANTRVKFELVRGVARSQSGDAVKKARQNFRFNTPVAASGVRGTDFTVFTDDNTSRVAVLSGGVTVSGFAGGCQPEGGGPCEGAGARELYAGQKGHMLQISKGQAVQLLQGSGSLAPDVVAPPRTDEPAGHVSLSPVNNISLDPKKDVTLQERAQQLTNTSTPGNGDGSTGPAVKPPPLIDTGTSPTGPGTDPTGPTTNPLALREVTWGRWQPVLGKSADAGLTSEGADRIAYNNYYVLMRAKSGDTFVPPQTGTVGFALAQSDAVVYNGMNNTQTAATVRDGKLEVNFGASTFATSLNLQTEGEQFALAANGRIAKDGKLYGDSVLKYPTNMTVEGVLQSENKASYLFQAPLGAQRTASGVTVWSR